MVQIIFTGLQALLRRLRASDTPVDVIEHMSARERADLPPHHPRCELC